MNTDDTVRAEAIVAEALGADEPRVGRFERTMAHVAVHALQSAGLLVAERWCEHHEAPGSCPVDACKHHCSTEAQPAASYSEVSMLGAQRALMCNECAVWVLDQERHSAWHHNLEQEQER